MQHAGLTLSDAEAEAADRDLFELELFDEAQRVAMEPSAAGPAAAAPAGADDGAEMPSLHPAIERARARRLSQEQDGSTMVRL